MKILCSNFIVVLALVVGGLSGQCHPGDGIVVNEDGTIYFVARNPLHDTDHHACIYQLKADETEATPFYTSTHPSSNIYIVMGQDGNLYGAESNYLGECDGKDKYTTRVWEFGVDGSKTELLRAREVRSPYGGPAYLVDGKGTFLFAVDSTIRKRTPDGDEVVFHRTTTAKNDGNDDDIELKIFGLTWGPDESIFILRLNRVEVLEKDGSIRMLYSGLENLPMDITVDKTGNVFLPNWRARKVFKISPHGDNNTILTSAEPWGAEGVALNGDDLVILEFTGPPSPKIIPRLRVIRPNGTMIERFQF